MLIACVDFPINQDANKKRFAFYFVRSIPHFFALYENANALDHDDDTCNVMNK